MANPFIDTKLGFLNARERARLEVFRSRTLQSGVASVLVGAGISVRAGLPSGAELAQRLCDDTGIDENDLAALCEQAERIHGRSYVTERLLEHIDDDDAMLSDAHQLLARIPFARYLTTNIDRLTEAALRDAGRRPAVISLPGDMIWARRTGYVPVIKLHGTLEHPETLRFSTADLTAFVSSDPALAHELREALTRFPMLVVGYAARDPDFVSVANTVREQTGAEGHLIVDFGLSDVERQRLLELGFFLIDPGAGQFGRLADILAFLTQLPDEEVMQLVTRHMQRSNPFPGLAAYSGTSLPFFGRDNSTSRVLAELESGPAIRVMFGESGVGKSSLVRAGLLPALRAAGSTAAILRLVAGAPLDTQLVEIARRMGAAANSRRVLFIDQFEEIFYEPFEPHMREELVESTLSRVAAMGTQIVLVMRSDEIHRMHGPDKSGRIPGAYTDPIRVEPMTNSTAAWVVSQVLATREYNLSSEAIQQLLHVCGHPDSPERHVYLPYLQLFTSKFFEWLEDEHRSERGFGRRIPVSSEAIARFRSDGLLLEEHVRRAVAELGALVPDRAFVLALLEQLVHGGRRRYLPFADISGKFADPGMARLMLRRLSSLRVTYFDERTEAYVLLHDSLAPVVRSYLDDARTDFSDSELLAVAKRACSAGIPFRLAVAATRQCLLRGLPSAWAERASDRSPVDILKELLADAPDPRLGAAIWTRLLVHARSGASPQITAPALYGEIVPLYGTGGREAILGLLTLVERNPEVDRFLISDIDPRLADDHPVLATLGLPELSAGDDESTEREYDDLSNEEFEDNDTYGLVAWNGETELPAALAWLRSTYPSLLPHLFEHNEELSPTAGKWRAYLDALTAWATESDRLTGMWHAARRVLVHASEDSDAVLDLVEWLGETAPLAPVDLLDGVASRYRRLRSGFGDERVNRFVSRQGLARFSRPATVLGPIGVQTGSMLEIVRAARLLAPVVEPDVTDAFAELAFSAPRLAVQVVAEEILAWRFLSNLDAPTTDIGAIVDQSESPEALAASLEQGAEAACAWRVPQHRTSGTQRTQLWLLRVLRKAGVDASFNELHIRTALVALAWYSALELKNERVSRALYEQLVGGRNLRVVVDEWRAIDSDPNLRDQAFDDIEEIEHLLEVKTGEVVDLVRETDAVSTCFCARDLRRLPQVDELFESDDQGLAELADSLVYRGQLAASVRSTHILDQALLDYFESCRRARESRCCEALIDSILLSNISSNGVTALGMTHQEYRWALAECLVECWPSSVSELVRAVEAHEEFTNSFVGGTELAVIVEAALDRAKPADAETISRVVLMLAEQDEPVLEQLAAALLRHPVELLHATAIREAVAAAHGTPASGMLANLLLRIGHTADEVVIGLRAALGDATAAKTIGLALDNALVADGG